MTHITNCRSRSIILISLFLLSVTYVTSALAWESITDPAIPTDTTLRSLWGTSDADLFIIGDKGTILHFNGSTWTKATPTSQNLNDIGGNSAGTVFAVGNSYWDTSAWKATILKSTDAGASWSQADITTDRHLLGVWADASAAIAVGSFGAMLQNTGSSDWPSIAGITFNTLNDVWGSSATEVYAVGFNGTIVCFKDDNWVRLSSGTTSNLQSISGSGSNGFYAVGFGGTILHSSDGQNWVPLNSGTDQNLHGVWVSATTGNVFVAGDNGVILHKTSGETTWSKIVYQTPAGFKPKFHTVWGSPTGYVYIAGENGTVLKQFVDSDSDGSSDEEDNCPSKPNAENLGTCLPGSDKAGDICYSDADCVEGCSDNGTCSRYQEDSDQDGLGDVCDTDCTDNDFDGVCDAVDNSPGEYNPDQGDYDGDGVGDVGDVCITDPNKTTSAGACGCGIADDDSDSDGIPDCIDPCPQDNNPFCVDECPNDPHKVAPGQCGCGNKDFDSDGDGVANCLDKCPYDPEASHQAPEECGCYCDNDADGYGAGAIHPHGYQCADGKLCVWSSSDCDDTDPIIHPYAPVSCNGKDNNCDGQVDNIKIISYRDEDGDGYGNPALYVEACPKPTGYVESNADCDDHNAGIHPEAEEVCDGKDNNCDGTIDEVHYAPSIIYTGMYLAAVNMPLTISVTLTDPRQMDNPIADKQVNFIVKDNDAEIRSISAVTNAAGVAETVISPGLNVGIYTIESKFDGDDCYLPVVADTQLLAIYDPSGGFVTGGGWITSPTGAYLAEPALTGKATFGFVSKYNKGAKVPTGETEFKFMVADLNFHSDTYDWLVVAGTRAQYKGTGTINDAGNYGFMLTAIDGQVKGGDGIDKFRIKIWDKATSAVVYDNQLGASDTADPTTAISGGSIVVHK